jgi:hypothetical protein
MSALGQKRTCALRNAMSTLPPKADIKTVTSQSNVKQQPRGFSGIFEIGVGGVFWEKCQTEGPVRLAARSERDRHPESK